MLPLVGIRRPASWEFLRGAGGSGARGPESTAGSAYRARFPSTFPETYGKPCRLQSLPARPLSLEPAHRGGSAKVGRVFRASHHGGSSILTSLFRLGGCVWTSRTLRRFAPLGSLDQSSL